MNLLIKNWLRILFPKKYHSESRKEYVAWKDLEKRLQYKIKNKEIFREALRHRSHPSCSGPSPELSNERLEFLGDAIINFYVGDFLYRSFKTAPEGELTKMRSKLVSREFLAKKSKQLGLGEFLVLGEGETRSGGRKKNSILSNALEAIVGALYLDGGHGAAWEFIKKVVLFEYKTMLQSEGRNYKGDLLEYIQKRHLPMPKFVTKKETGPDHKKTYTVAVLVGKETLGLGKGKSKKIAEQDAARYALEKINNSKG